VPLWRWRARAAIGHPAVAAAGAVRRPKVTVRRPEYVGAASNAANASPSGCVFLLWPAAHNAGRASLLRAMAAAAEQECSNGAALDRGRRKE